MSDRVTTRVRGFAPWAPYAKSVALLDQLKAILIEYADYLPLTVRQIFYRLVGAHDYDKTELAYDRLGEMLNRARRAGVIEFGAIRDDGAINSRPPNVWASVEDMVEAVIATALRLKLDRQAGQSRRLMCCIEAQGMAPMVQRLAHPYGIPVLSSGGFDSTTVKHDMAQTIVAADAAIEILHIGDHDPSGVHVFLSVADDVTEFCRELEGADEPPLFTRLAVTLQQTRELGLPTAPAKTTDRRAFEGETVQVEAIPPDVLSQIIERAIVERIDQAAYQHALAEEERIRKRFQRKGGLIPTLRSRRW